MRLAIPRTECHVGSFARSTATRGERMRTSVGVEDGWIRKCTVPLVVDGRMLSPKVHTEDNVPRAGFQIFDP